MMNSRPTKKPKSPRGPFKELRGYVTGIMGSKAFLVAISFVAALFFCKKPPGKGSAVRAVLLQNRLSKVGDHFVLNL